MVDPARHLGQHPAPEQVFAPGICQQSEVSPAAKLVHAVLWLLAGCRPGTVQTSAAYLAHVLGLTCRTCRDCLTAMRERGYLAIRDRTLRGQMMIYVADAAEAAVGHLLAPDPQRELFPCEEIDARGFPQKEIDARGFPRLPTAGQGEPGGQTPRAPGRAPTVPTDLPTTSTSLGTVGAHEFHEFRERALTVIAHLWSDVPARFTLKRDHRLIYRLTVLSLDEAHGRWIIAAMRETQANAQRSGPGMFWRLVGKCAPPDCDVERLFFSIDVPTWALADPRDWRPPSIADPSFPKKSR